MTAQKATGAKEASATERETQTHQIEPPVAASVQKDRAKMMTVTEK